MDADLVLLFVRYLHDLEQFPARVRSLSSNVSSSVQVAGGCTHEAKLNLYADIFIHNKKIIRKKNEQVKRSTSHGTAD